MAKVTQKYYAAPGSQIPEDKVDAVGYELEVVDPGKSPTPDAVVEFARVNQESALHSLFEWDDPTAAEKYRKFQARNILNHIQIKVQTPEGEDVMVRAFHSVKVYTVTDSGETQQEQRYCHISVVGDDQDLQDQTKAKMLSELKGWRKRYDVFSACFPDLISEIDSVLEMEPGDIQPAAVA